MRRPHSGYGYQPFSDSMRFYGAGGYRTDLYDQAGGIWQQLGAAMVIDAYDDALAGRTTPYEQIGGELLTLGAGSATGAIANSPFMGGTCYIGNATRWWQHAANDPGNIGALLNGQSWTLLAFAQGTGAVSDRLWCNKAVDPARGVGIGTRSVDAYGFGFAHDGANNFNTSWNGSGTLTFTTSNAKVLRLEFDATTGTSRCYSNANLGETTVTAALIGADLRGSSPATFMNQTGTSRQWVEDIGHVSIWPGVLSAQPALVASINTILAPRWTKFVTV